MSTTKKHRLLTPSDGIHGVHAMIYPNLTALYAGTIAGLSPSMSIADLGRVAYVLDDRQFYVLRHQPATPSIPINDLNLEWKIITPGEWSVQQNGTYAGLFTVSHNGDNEGESHTYFETGGAVFVDGDGKTGFGIPDPRANEYPGHVYHVHDSGGHADTTPIRIFAGNFPNAPGTLHCFADPAGPSDQYNWVELTQPYGSMSIRWMPHTDPAKRKWLVVR